MRNEFWTEIDLYWFQGESPEIKAKKLFDRLSSLFMLSPYARKGISICVGWLYDSVLYWNSDPEMIIPTCQPPAYEAWTYRRLAELISSLKSEAAVREISDFHVSISLLGGHTMAFDPDSTCEGWGGRTQENEEKAKYNIVGKWFAEHEEIDWSTYGIAFFGSKINIRRDDRVSETDVDCFGDYFADKLCDFCKYTSFDAVVLRDSVFTPAYRRGNKNRYMSVNDADRLNDSFIRTFSRIKSKMPKIIIIGYSSGISPSEELRSHGFDLEKVAGSGYLDLWITQTWASAWQDYWPANSMGYTFQLTNVLMSMAKLSGKKCKHLFLVETFDAWEPWDSIGQYPSKVSWELWAYSHAALITPKDTLYSAGCYMSWMNRGNKLLSESTVQYLCDRMKDCMIDLEKKPIPGGPCIVYHKAGFDNLMGSTCSYSHGEEIDDWASMLVKYGIPVLSITRSEWLENINRHDFIFPVPAALDDQLMNTIERFIIEGRKIFFTGQAALLPERIKKVLNLKTLDEPAQCEMPSCAQVCERVSSQIKVKGLQINQRQRTFEESEDWETLITCLGGPVMAKNRNNKCFIWETPEWGTPYELHLTSKSIGSVELYLTVAHIIGSDGWDKEEIQWINEDYQKPLCFLYWKYADGHKTLLFGNLETGCTGNSQFAVKGDLIFNDHRSYILESFEKYKPGITSVNETGYRIALAPHMSAIISVKETEKYYE